MNIIITGGLGRISKPLTTDLVKKGHHVTVVSRNEDRRTAIESLGAKAAIGSLEDPIFLSNTFATADIAYLMEPPFNFFDQRQDIQSFWLHIANCYCQAVKASGLTKLVHLSSIGAHTDKGVGMLATHHLVERALQSLPDTVAIKTMRPVGFYYNMFAFIPTIKQANAIIQNYGGDETEPWVSPLDIAGTIVSSMEEPFTDRTTQYIASEEVSPNALASILGEAIQQPALEWRIIPDDQFQNNLLQAGFNPPIAKGFTEMNAARRNGLYDDYNKNKPTLGKTKLSSFAKEFAALYHSQKIN